MQRRATVLAASAALLAGTLLPGAPAQAAPADWSLSDWAATCAGADAVYCIEDATITPVGGTATPLAEAGLSATAAAADDSLRWAVTGWDGLPESFTGGRITLVVRTGEYVPRLTTAVAAGLDVSRTDDGAGHYTLTVTGRAAPVSWITGDGAADCAARQYCGEYDTMADEAGTGFRFEGQTQDLDGYGSDFVDAIDGAYLYTDAQAHTDMLTYDLNEPGPYLGLGVLGGPHLDLAGDPVRNAVSAWLPAGYFAATGTTVPAALATGFDVVGTSDETTASLPVEATELNGGVRLEVSGIGFGAALGEIEVYPRESGATPGQGAPGSPTGVRVIGRQVSWDAPEWDGGAPITGYRVRVYAAATGGGVDQRCDADADETACTVEDYGYDGDWYAAVSAVSPLGESDPSARTAPTVVKPPSAPGAVRVTAGLKRLVVSWAAPLSNGGAPLDRYVVRGYQAAAGGTHTASCETTAATRTCTLTGLANGARLWIGVSAVNLAGEGPAATRLPGTTWTVAGAARSVAARSARGRVTVTWVAPATTGGAPISGYRAELYTASNGGSVAARCSVGTAGRFCETAALPPGRVYYATVTALNSVGASVQPARVRIVVKR